METLEVKVEVLDELTASKCLLCLQPAESDELKLIPDVVSSFINLTTSLDTQKLCSVSKNAFFEGMEHGSYCKKCYDRLYELHFLQNQIKHLQESLDKLETEVEDGILVAYLDGGACLQENIFENKFVAELRQEFYRVSLKPFEAGEETHAIEGSHVESETDEYIVPDASPVEGESSEDGEYSDIYLHPRRRSFRKRRETFKMQENVPISSGRRNNMSNTSKKEATQLRKASLDKLKQRTSVKLVRLDPRNCSKSSKQKLELRRRSSRTTQLNHKSERGNRERKNFNCTKCCARFKKTSHLVGHVDSVHTSTEYSCINCSGTFNNPRNLKIHTDLYHTSTKGSDPSSSAGRKSVGQKNIICPECPVRFTHISHFKSHLEKKHKDTIRKHQYPCPVCCPEKIFMTEQHLSAHLNKNHLVLTKVKNHECEQCGRLFLKKGDLVNHISTHTGVRAFICDICGISTKRSQELSRHKRVAHTLERPFSCDTCGKRFPYNWQRVVHMKNHQDQRDYKCAVPGCLKTFKFSGNLNQHMLVHRGVKYICHICGESYTRTGYLKKHIRLIHAGLNLETVPGVVPTEPTKNSKRKSKIDLGDGKIRSTPNTAELNDGVQFSYVNMDDDEVNFEEPVPDSEREYNEDEASCRQPLHIRYCQLVNEDQQSTEYILIQQ